ncbi:hypothetical protein D918_04882 [Trichuris suis]|nr:hypothetical protein D918_04882 [Trichuris suis]
MVPNFAPYRLSARLYCTNLASQIRNDVLAILLLEACCTSPSNCLLRLHHDVIVELKKGSGHLKRFTQ